ACEQLLQYALAAFELDVREVVAAQVRKVEYLVDQTRRAIRGEGLLKLPKAARAVRLQRDELAVEQRLIDIEIGQRLDQHRETCGPVLEVSAIEPHGPPFDARNEAITV